MEGERVEGEGENVKGEGKGVATEGAEVEREGTHVEGEGASTAGQLVYNPFSQFVSQAQFCSQSQMSRQGDPIELSVPTSNIVRASDDPLCWTPS